MAYSSMSERACSLAFFASMKKPVRKGRFIIPIKDHVFPDIKHTYQTLGISILRYVRYSLAQYFTRAFASYFISFDNT